MSALNCGYETLFNLFGVVVFIIDLINGTIKVNGSEKTVKCKPDLMKGVHENGLLSEAMMIYLFQTVC